jgi:hypothetical protein
MSTPSIVNTSTAVITWASGANVITGFPTPTAGNALIVQFNIQNIGTATITVTDSTGSNTYSQIATAGAGGSSALSSQHAYVCPALGTAPASVTVTLSAAPTLTSGGYVTMEVSNYGSIDGAYGAANLTTAGTTISVSAAATTLPDDIYVMSLAVDQGLGSIALTSPASTTAVSTGGNIAGGINVNYLPVFTAGTPSATWTWSGSNGNLSALIYAIAGPITPNTALNPVNIGTAPFNGTGDAARVGITKVSEDIGNIVAGLARRATTNGVFGTTTSAGTAFQVIDGNQTFGGSQFNGMSVMITTGSLPLVSGGVITATSNLGYESLITGTTAHTLSVAGFPFATTLGTGYQILQTPASASDGMTTQVGSNASTVIDSTKAWTSNQWQGYQLTLLGGAYAGQSMPIASNTTSGSMTLSVALPGTTDTGTPYVIGSRPLAANQYLAAGTTVTVSPGVRTLILDGSTTITVTFPLVPQDTDELHVCTSTAITSFAASAAGTVKGAPGSLSANTGIGWVYKASNTTWYRLY